MGTLVDTTVFIDLEQAVRRLPPATAMAAVGERLKQQLGPDEEVAIAAITASEPLHGVHRVPEAPSPPRSVRRGSPGRVSPLPFGLLAARAHARIWTELAATGQNVGPHDRLVAATAITAGWRVGTANTRHFDRIDGLDILAISFAE